MIVIDTLRRDFLGFYGFEEPSSPFLDSLARSGVVYDDASTQASHTYVSTATLFTSRYFPLFVPHAGYEPPPDFTPHRVRQMAGYDYLADQNLTLAEALRDEGFRTLAIFTNPHHHPTSGFWQGFEEAEYLPDPKGPEESAPADEVRTRFLHHLDATKDGRRLFAYLHLMEPHTPYLPPAELAHRFADSATGARALHATGKLPPGHRTTSEDVEAMRGLYAAEVRAADDVVRQLIADLETRALWEDTLLIVASDHGEEFMEHGGLGHGQTLEREQLRAPLLLAGRLGVPPARVEGVVRNLDLAPTILALLGLPARSEFTGLPLPGLGLGPEGAPRRSHAWWRSLRSLTDDQWHFSVDRKQDHARLYDLDVDPEGRRNVASQHPAVASRLRSELDALEARHRATLDEARALGAAKAEPAPAKIRRQLQALGYAE